MAHVFKERAGRSKRWICYYRMANGKWAKRSTKTADKEKAEIICKGWEQTEDLARGGDLVETQIREVMQRTLERVTGKRAYNPSVKEWLMQWLQTETGTVAPATLDKYEQSVHLFLKHLGSRAELRLQAISASDIVGFRDWLHAAGRTAKTVNGIFRKVLNRPFRVALDQGIIARNPVTAVKSLRELHRQKGTFTSEQLKKLLGTAEGDWRGLIVAGYYTGARLGDLARLRWSQVHLAGRYILFFPEKTKSRASSPVQIPIHPQLEEFLREPPDVNPEDPVFPTLYNMPGPGRSGLSMAFMALMKRAGIDPGKQAKAGKKGRSVSTLSFHSLRHTFNSALANAGVSQEVRQKLTGHATREMNALYTHHELATIRQAVEMIGRLPQA